MCKVEVNRVNGVTPPTLWEQALRNLGARLRWSKLMRLSFVSEIPMLNIKSLIAATVLSSVAALSFAATPEAPKDAAAAPMAAAPAATASEAAKPMKKHAKKMKKAKAPKAAASDAAAK